jgi:sulfhydrogenase subunit beta (sulfur reductase)
MDRGIIRKPDIPKLAGQGRFYAPGRAAGGAAGSCELVEKPADIVYDFSNVRVPLKQVFFPQTEVMCTFDFDQVADIPAPEEPILVFGCRPCDSRALAQLDAVFGPGSKGFADPYYLKRRENSLVISLACTSPCATCFCTATGGGPAGTEGADLIAHDLAGLQSAANGGALLIEAVSEKGRAFLQSHQSLFTEAAPAIVPEVKKNIAAAEAAVRQANDLGVDLGAELSALKKNMDPLFDDECWEELTVSCIGCGACTYLCPTCHCFDIADEARMYQGRRIRTWDSCQFALFTKHASGHNPRTNKKERLRQRFMHKFSYAVENIGAALCVGCGRCIAACPVNLDIRDVIQSFAEETKREIAS